MNKSPLEKLITEFESQNNLLKIKDFVNPELEITEFADRMMKSPKGGKALFFENTGTEFPLLINHFGSEERMFSILGIKNWNEPAEKIDLLFKKIINPPQTFFAKLSALSELKNFKNWIPKKINGKGKCQEVIMDNPDLSKLPILKCWQYDGGKFITLPLVISEDPDTKIRNIGMYRMQIFDKKTAGMHWHLHKGGAVHFEKYKNLKKIMPISVVLGGDPILTYSATAPLPQDIDEFILAGFLRNKNVKLVKSITNDIYVPEDADFVIEGYIDPNEDFALEGPFGDHTGFYSLADYYPKFHLTCITHRKNAIYPATIVGIPPMEDFYLGKATERIFLKPIQIAIAPEIIDIRLPDYGVAHNLVLVKAKTTYHGQAIKIMNALLGAGQMMFSKIIICFNENVDIQDDKRVFDVLMKLDSFKSQTVFSKGPADVLDHSAYKFTFGGKILIDATNPKNKPVENREIKFIKNKEFNKTEKLSGINIILDKPEEIKDNHTAIWLILSNIDPNHDVQIEEDYILINASSKNLKNNNFKRDWPNPVCTDKKTIEKINKIWCEYTNTDFVESPSLKYIGLASGNSAIYE
ncbi:MAG: menaquinone biosynthesis decarboxylase [Bacteroidales bacterium]|jgi:4-hydroxy-3-polyprenylbenzoate decarboxylase|nr:menaquinone biosynthesis decarboxylase [Bacteroidales bacterium]MCK9498091.1 menaquinone biosynthesis decarboxylase [Bacteroidales bacterium]MDY0313581.1 menaquinone biosynthesis decarboxylase [Bacteroidales bacterium]NLB86963.1 menaquinone biosynthesis decarboxylase [Bacteroidales bacterium]NLB87024.1 menaquinone biosynthesis decarboxylase [Bacteroidales bacterium]